LRTLTQRGDEPLQVCRTLIAEKYQSEVKIFFLNPVDINIWILSSISFLRIEEGD